MKRKRKFPIGLKVILVFAIFYGFYSFEAAGNAKTVKLQEIAENKQQIEALTREIEKLEEEIKDSNSTEYIEKVARDEFGMVKPREVVYVDKEKDNYDSNK